MSEMVYKHHSRVEPGYRDLSERITDFREVEQELTNEQVIEQSERCLDCGTPFCHGYACPLGNFVPETNKLVSEARWREALELLLTTHQFPEFTARICPALCEGSCVMGINQDAVTIRQIEKKIIEKGFSEGWVAPRPPKHRKKEKVAVIGSGPAGLAVADRLNKKGYNVIVYEKELHPGGLLTYGIPNFKLDKKIVMRRINLMKEEGVVFESGVKAGIDISFRYLNQRFNAIVLTGGTQQPRDLDIEGRNLKGVYFATEYLSRQNKAILGEAVESDRDLDARGKAVVIVGGGDTGSDCLGTAIRQGATEVYQLEIMPRAPVERKENNPWPLWPKTDRTSSSHKEGGIRYWEVRPLKLIGGENGRIREILVVEVEWINRGGRIFPEDIRGSEFKLPADLILLAMGFTGPGSDPLADYLNLERDEGSNIKVDSGHMTSSSGIFAAGDMASGQSLVVRAIADGKEAADDVERYLLRLK